MNHEIADKEWDLVIEGKSSLFGIKFRDVWRYRDLLVLFVNRYKRLENGRIAIEIL